MTRRLPLTGWLLLLALQPGCGGQEPSYGLGEVVEEHFTQPVAVVNGVSVYASTYEQILDQLRHGIPAEHPESVELYVSAKSRALEKAIDEELLRQEAVRRGFEPSQREVARLYGERVAEAGSEEEYLDGARGMLLSKSEIVDAIKRTVAIDRLVQEDIEATLVVTESQARAYYDAHPDLFIPKPWVKIGQIFVDAPPSWPVDRRAEALSRLGGALEKLREGGVFEDLARQVSEDPSAEQGGLIGFVQKGSLPEKVDDAVFRIQPGEVTGIVETERGYHLFKVYERAGGRLPPFEEVREEAMEKLRQRRKGKRLSDLVDSLRENSEIERLLT